MNVSGAPIREYLRREHWDLTRQKQDDDVLVLLDDITLPFGTCRFRFGGGHGGHRGLEDVIRRLGTKKFSRLRIGVGEPQDGVDVASYVIGRFEYDERQKLNRLFNSIAQLLHVYLHRGVDVAASVANGRTQLV